MTRSVVLALRRKVEGAFETQAAGTDVCTERENPEFEGWWVGRRQESGLGGPLGQGGALGGLVAVCL
ncbi:MAG: hypothetical protein WHT82_08865 [Limisphaera sp.]